jgi:hypothetical protein
MLVLAVGLLGCSRRDSGPAPAPVVLLDRALRPSTQAAALKKLGGGHVRVEARFGAGAAAPNEAITTTTDVWVDRSGNYRIVESNDRDGGREVILHGRELHVALRYGKMIRRPAEEPEPKRLIEEALGAPFAAWDLLRPFAEVKREETGAQKDQLYRLAKSAAAPQRDDPEEESPDGGQAAARRWRKTVKVTQLGGEFLIANGTDALVKGAVRSAFTLDRAGTPLQGETLVQWTLDGVGTTAFVVRPEAEELSLRQRTVPEERELLGGLGGRVNKADGKVKR